VWQRLQRRGMQQDFSWTRSAAEYVNLYTAVLDAAGRKRPTISRLGAVSGA
jgi:glycogen synthase